MGMFLGCLLIGTNWAHIVEFNLFMRKSMLEIIKKNILMKINIFHKFYTTRNAKIPFKLFPSFKHFAHLFIFLYTGAEEHTLFHADWSVLFWHFINVYIFIAIIIGYASCLIVNYIHSFTNWLNNCFDFRFVLNSINIAFGIKNRWLRIRWDVHI